MKNNTLTMVLIGIVIAVAAFFGGMKYQQSKSPFAMGAGGQFRPRGQQSTTNNGQNAQLRTRNGNFGGGTIGNILSIDADTITVQLMDGSSKIVNILNATTISKTTTASKSELKVGDTITAIGEPNTDGSVNADRIQLNPPQMNRQSSPSASPAQ